MGCTLKDDAESHVFAPICQTALLQQAVPSHATINKSYFIAEDAPPLFKSICFGEKCLR